MRYCFPYDSIAPIEIPSSHPVDVYTVQSIEASRQQAEEIVAASLAHPIGMPRLSQLVHSGSRILILVDDSSRPTPAHQIMPALLGELGRGGADESNIRFLIALGTHRAMTAEEIAAKIGAQQATRFRVLNHRWHDPAALHSYGRLEDGTEVLLNRAMHESDVVIGVGSIAPHPAAGFSGGGKIITGRCQRRGGR